MRAARWWTTTTVTMSLSGVLAIPGHPPADATPRASPAAGSPTLTISAPAAANLGSATTSAGSLGAALGQVTVTETATATALRGWTTTVSTTDFTTTTGAMSRSLAAAQVSYLGGAFTSTGTALGMCTTSATRQDLSTPRAAYTCAGAASLGAAVVRWNPTVTITIPPGTLAGTYRGTITHSVS